MNDEARTGMRGAALRGTGLLGTGLRGKDVAVALSLANLVFLRIWGEILAVSSPDAYYSSLANGDVYAVMVNVLLLGGLILGATAIARGFGRRGRMVIIAGFVGVIVMQLNGIGPELATGVFTVIDPWKNGKYLEALAPVLVLLLITAVAVKWPAATLRRTVGLVYVLTPFVAVTFGRAILLLVQVDPSAALAPTTRAIGTAVDSVRGPRVILIVMDAMTRRLAIDARPAGLKLPELDRLRAQSVDATQVSQIGWVTKVSVPALLSGLPVTDADPADDNELLLTLASGRTQEWSEAPNLLTEAQALGGVAIAVGWYHPYCRMFTSLDGCATYAARMVGSRARETGFWRALLDQQLALIPYLRLRLRQIDIVKAQRRDLVRAATSGGRGLIFLHAIAPHTPWIWDETTGAYTLTRFEPDGYYGNLALADAVLGDIRRAMEQAGQWDSAAVVLVSDHVMRYRPAYLKEPDDRRVPLIVKLPGGSGGVTYDRPLSAMVAHGLVQALLRGTLRTNEDVTTWLDAQPVARALRRAPTR